MTFEEALWLMGGMVAGWAVATFILNKYRDYQTKKWSREYAERTKW